MRPYAGLVTGSADLARFMLRSDDFRGLGLSTLYTGGVTTDSGLQLVIPLTGETVVEAAATDFEDEVISESGALALMYAIDNVADSIERLESYLERYQNLTKRRDLDLVRNLKAAKRSLRRFEV
jgi:hypothetical protein